MKNKNQKPTNDKAKKSNSDNTSNKKNDIDKGSNDTKRQVNVERKFSGKKDK